MNLFELIRKPLVAAILGAAAIAVPVSALYAVAESRAVATAAAAAPAAAATGASPVTPAPGSPTPTVTLPDFSAMVQKYGPAVVNISVVSKVPTSFNSQGDENPDENEGPSENDPFGPNSPFAPFLRGHLEAERRHAAKERRERAVGTEGIVLARTLVLVGILVPLRVEGRRHLGDDADVDHRRAVLLHHGAEVRERHGGSGRAGRRRDRARA